MVLKQHTVGERSNASLSSLGDGVKPWRGSLDSETIVAWRRVKSVTSISPSPRLPLTVGSMNMLDPVVASISGYAMKSNLRYESIAKAFIDGGVPLLACQEANSESADIMLAHGYQVVGMDTQAGIKPDYYQEKSTYNGFSWGRLKRAWTGVQLCFDPKKFRIHDNYKPQFHAYAPEHQKNWTHVFTAFLNTLVQTARQMFTECSHRGLGHQIFEALSGPLRTDGLLVTHLSDQLTRQHVIMCVSHLESFDRKISDLQLQALTARLKQLQAENPDALVIMAADFNWQVGPGASKADLRFESISGRFKRELGAITMPFEMIEPSLVGGRKAIDGVFFLCPKKGSVRGITLDPSLPQKPQDKFSDHHAVIAQLNESK